MKLSTRVRYGTRALVELAINSGTDSDLDSRPGPLSIAKIARRQNLSVKYLEQIMATLRHAGMVSSMPGMHGGYQLTRRPSDIQMDEVYLALEGSAWIVDCLGDPESCDMSERCPTRPLWMKLTTQLLDTLKTTSVADLVPPAGADDKSGKLKCEIPAPASTPA